MMNVVQIKTKAIKINDTKTLLGFNFYRSDKADKAHSFYKTILRVVDNDELKRAAAKTAEENPETPMVFYTAFDGTEYGLAEKKQSVVSNSRWVKIVDNILKRATKTFSEWTVEEKDNMFDLANNKYECADGTVMTGIEICQAVNAGTDLCGSVWEWKEPPKELKKRGRKPKATAVKAA